MRTLEDKAFLLLTALATVAFGWILWPLCGGILWAVVAAILFGPLYHRLAFAFGRRNNLAAAVTMLTVLVIVVLPVIAVGASLAQEATGIYDKTVSGELDFGLYFKQVLGVLPVSVQGWLEGLGMGNLGGLLQRFLAGLKEGSRFLAEQVLTIGQMTVEFVINLFVMAYLLFFLLRDGDRIAERIGTAIPLEPEHRHALFAKFGAVIRATVKGDILVAILQGGLGGFMFWLLGLHAPMLWAVVMAFLSLLPALGASLVWLPTAVFLLATGAVWQGLALLAFGALVISLVDNFLRPALVGKDTKLPDYVVLISTIGGLEAFGLNGFILGPVIASVFLVLWETFPANGSDTPSGG